MLEAMFHRPAFGWVSSFFAKLPVIRQTCYPSMMMISFPIDLKIPYNAKFAHTQDRLVFEA